MSSHNKGQKSPTKSVPAPQRVQLATGGKGPVKSGKTTAKGCC